LVATAIDPVDGDVHHPLCSSGRSGWELAAVHVQDPQRAADVHRCSVLVAPWLPRSAIRHCVEHMNDLGAPTRLDMLRFLERVQLGDLDRTRKWIAAEERRETERQRGAQAQASAPDWLRERRRRWPQATNPHLLITAQSYRHPASPQISYCAMRAAFDQIRLLPRQVWADRILDAAGETANPVHLVCLFGIHPTIAVKYAHAAHPDKALPRIR
jgi:hypothetical protein